MTYQEAKERIENIALLAEGLTDINNLMSVKKELGNVLRDLQRQYDDESKWFTGKETLDITSSIYHHEWRINRMIASAMANDRSTAKRCS